MRQRAILVTLRIHIFSPFFCLVLRPSGTHSSRGCCCTLVVTLPTPPAAAPQPLIPSGRDCPAVRVQLQHVPGMPDTHIQLTPHGASRVYLLEGHGTTELRIYLHQSGNPHLLQTDAGKAKQARLEMTTNVRIALYTSSGKKNARQCYWKHPLFPRNVEKHSGSSIISLLQAKVFAFSFAKTLWNSRHKSQSTKTNTSKPVLHS